MNAAQPEKSWAPGADPDEEEYVQRFPIDGAPETISYVQRMVFSSRNQFILWAVSLTRLVDGRWRRVAVYDICHHKGMHIHLYDRRGVEFTQVPLRPVSSQQDAEDCLEEALDLVCRHWEDNMRRSDRGQ